MSVRSRLLAAVCVPALAAVPLVLAAPAANAAMAGAPVVAAVHTASGTYDIEQYAELLLQEVVTLLKNPLILTG
jgi:hypothetical protein